MAVKLKTKVKVPYGIYVLTRETTEIDVERSFDTERCILPRIATHSATKRTVTQIFNTEEQFDTKRRVRSGSGALTKRVAIIKR